MSVILRNQGWVTRVFALAATHDTSKMTLRRGSTRPVTIAVPARGTVDVCRYLPGKTESEVREILAASKELERLSPWISVSVPSSEEKVVERQKAGLISARTRLLNLVLRVQVMGEQPAPVPVSPTEKERRDAARKMKRAEDIVRARGEATEEEKASVQVLEAGVQALSENTPSVRWEKQRLLDYAKERGITLDPSTPKNMILRKLRGMG